MSAGFALYAVDVYRPRKRCSPHTLPCGVEALDADVVEIARPVHGRARVGLGDDEEVGNARVGAHLRRQRGEARRDVLRGALAQDAEARPGDDLAARPRRRPRPDRGSGSPEACSGRRRARTGTPCPRRAPPAASAAAARRFRRRCSRACRCIFFQSVTAMRTSSSTRATSVASAASARGVGRRGRPRRG